MNATLLHRFEIRSTFFINSFCYLFIFSAFIWSLVLALAENPGPQGKLGFLDFTPIYGNRRYKFRCPQFGARRRGGGYGLPLLMATKSLIETMSRNMKDKFAALTDHMTNAHANAVVINKIENLIATSRHEKSTETSSRINPTDKRKTSDYC